MNTNQELQILTNEKNSVENKIKNLKVYRKNINRVFLAGQIATVSCVLVTTAGVIVTDTSVSMIGALAGIASFSAGSYYLEKRDLLDDYISFQSDWNQKLEKEISKRKDVGLTLSQSDDIVDKEEKIGFLLDIMFPEGLEGKTEEQIDELVESTNLPSSIQSKVRVKLLPKRKTSRV